MVFLVVAGLLILAGTTWLTMNRPEPRHAARYRRLVLVMLAASGSVIAGTFVAAVVLAVT